MVTLPVKEPINLKDGSHQGVIIDVIERDVSESGGYAYVDVIIELKEGDKPIKLKYGLPADGISEKNRAGRLLKALGISFNPKDNIDLNAVLVGKKVEFMTMNETTVNGTFATIVKNSIKSFLG